MLNVRSEERSKVQVFEFSERAGRRKQGDVTGRREKRESRELTDCCCSELEQRFSWNFYEGVYATCLPSLCQFVTYLQSLHRELQMCRLLAHWRLIDRLFGYVPQQLLHHYSVFCIYTMSDNVNHRLLHYNKINDLIFGRKICETI